MFRTNRGELHYERKTTTTNELHVTRAIKYFIFYNFVGIFSPFILHFFVEIVEK